MTPHCPPDRIPALTKARKGCSLHNLAPIRTTPSPPPGSGLGDLLPPWGSLFTTLPPQECSGSSVLQDALYSPWLSQPFPSKELQNFYPGRFRGGTLEGENPGDLSYSCVCKRKHTVLWWSGSGGIVLGSEGESRGLKCLHPLLGADTASTGKVC